MMRYLRILQSFLRNKTTIANPIFGIGTLKTAQHCKANGLENSGIDNISNKLALTENRVEEDIEVVEFDVLEKRSMKNVLFPNSKDVLITNLNNCASVEEVLKCFINNKHLFKVEHFTQTILVLRDIQIISCRYSRSNYRSFGPKILKNNEFTSLMYTIDQYLPEFDQTLLSHLLVNLSKLGVPIEHELMQKFAIKLRDLLKDTFSINNCANLFRAIFTENSVRPYYIVLELLPEVTNYIDKCQTPEQLENLSICLNKTNKIITKEILELYQERISFFLKNKMLKGTDYEALTEVVNFLNHPSWRDRYSILIAKCMLLFKDGINSLKVSTFLKVFEVLYANQEPGELLNDLQRCSAKFLQQIEDGDITDCYTHLKVFASIIYFSSPTNRVKFRNDVEKLFGNFDVNNVNFGILDLLRRVFSYVKISNKKLCEQYWDLNLEWLEMHADAESISQLCQNYVQFSSDLEFRQLRFENKMLTLIDDLLKSEIIFPNLLVGILKFYLIFGTDGQTIISLIDRFEDNITQFGALDCLKISECFKPKFSNENVPYHQAKRLKTLLNRITAQTSQFGDGGLIQNGLLIKAAILRNGFDDVLTEDLMIRYKEAEYMSSKILENICYIFFNTSSLIPEVINKCTEYILNNQEHVTGYNMEKLLFACYHLAYYPVNADSFFQVATDIIIRDHERLSGLSFLQCALSLAFFNKLPGSFIKLIFNVEFMDKLDTELKNCYSKEKYPQRVRNCLMQLNRIVCLEYPEYNVPWFHKKYVEEMQSKYVLESDNHFQIRFKQYLMRVLGTQDKILENVVTPYGYLIDFVINFNEKNNAVLLDATNIKRRLALLFIRPQGFTRLYTHLKGRHQMTKRHLEMFGYEVSVVKFSEWINLLYGDERMVFVKNVLWPQKVEESNTLKKR